MSCSPFAYLNSDSCGNVAAISGVYIMTVKGYIKLKPSFYWIEFKKACYDAGLKTLEIEQSIRNILR